MIRFKSYGGWKLPQIGPDDLFFYIRSLQGHPEASSLGFRGVWNQSETHLMVLEWFQRGLKLIFFFKKKAPETAV